MSDTIASIKEEKRPVPFGVETWPITDRGAWLERRQKDVTASTVGSLLGVHEYITAYGLWALKSGLVAEDACETSAMTRGRLLEPVAIKLLRELYPTWTITTPGNYYRDTQARLGCTPDAFAVDPSRPGFGVLQIKTVEPSVFRRKWCSVHSIPEPPLWIAAQAMVEADLTGASWASVVPMRVGFGIDIDVIDIPLHAELLNRIRNEVAAFWRSVDAKKPPDPDAARDGALIESMFEAKGETIDLSTDNLAMELADERERLSDAKSLADKRLKDNKRQLLMKMNRCAAARLADGRLITAKRIYKAESKVKAYNYIDLRVKGARS